MRGPLLAACLLASPAWTQTFLAPRDEDRAAVEKVLPDRVHAFSARELSELAGALRDPAWAERSAGYLFSMHRLSPADWNLLSGERRGQVLAEWVRMRLAASDAAAAALASRPNEDQKRHLSILAEAGLLSRGERLALSALAAPAAGKLRTAAAAKPAGGIERQRTQAGNTFDGETPDGPFALVLPLRGEEAEEPDGGLELDYQIAKLMVMNPQGFAAKRPDLGRGASPDEAARRARLPQRLGHIFQTADRLLAEDRLELRYGAPSELGPALATVDIAFEKDAKTGEPRWLIVLQVNAGLREADPVLLASVLAHEGQHVYNVERRIRKYGIEVAQHLGAFQEEEESAFLAGSYVDAAYHDPMRRAFEKRVAPDTWKLFNSHEELLALSELQDKDLQAHRSLLADLAAAELSHRGYLHPQGGILNLKTIEARYEDELKRLKAAKVAVGLGVKGAREEAARTSDSKYKAYLLGFTRRSPQQTLGGLEADISLTERLLDMIGKERKRGLSLS